MHATRKRTLPSATRPADVNVTAPTGNWKREAHPRCQVRGVTVGEVIDVRSRAWAGRAQACPGEIPALMRCWQRGDLTRARRACRLRRWSQAPSLLAT